MPGSVSFAPKSSPDALRAAAHAAGRVRFLAGKLAAAADHAEAVGVSVELTTGTTELCYRGRSTARHHRVDASCLADPIQLARAGMPEPEEPADG